MSARTHEVAAMRRAIELASRGRGTTSPNPVVGCVILDAAGAVAGEGFHAYAGGPHAEVVALRDAGERARGGTALVTLEPCGHTGRTGPCADALLSAGVVRVVAAVPDPSHGGAVRLREAGADVAIGLLADEAESVNAAWLTYVRTRKPYITWKFGATLDGRSAAADGTSRWITSSEARQDVHRLRSECDAIIAGSGTVLADNPMLTARSAKAARQPLRVVVDSDARTPLTAHVFDHEAATLLAVAEDADAPEGNVALVRLPRAKPYGLDLNVLMNELYRREIVSALLEGGPTLAGSFLAAGLIDRVVAYLAPTLLGAGLAALGDAGVATLAQAHRLRIEDITPIGPDVRITAAPVPGEET